MTNEYLSSDFSYKKYSLEQLDNWVHDAMNCEDLTPQDIYDTIIRCVDDDIEYHKKHLTKSIDLLSLLKGHREVDFGVGNDEPWDYDAAGAKIPCVTEANQKDWVDFWEESEKTQYTEEELDAMCEAAALQQEKDKCREYNLREAEYYNKRAQLDAEIEAIKATGGYEWTPESKNEEKGKYYWNDGRNSSFDEMIANGWQMTDDGFWIKEK
jgi:hypothetical protein